MKTIWILSALLTAVFAGCSGGPDLEFAVSHAESSEQSRALIESVPPSGLAYKDIMVDVNGRQFSFGQFSSFADRRFQVDGKSDANEAVEKGDVLSIPAAGMCKIKIMKGNEELASYEATIPDNHAPAAPTILDPAAQASGVSRTPTFRWSGVSDPSLVTYTLVYSIDPSMQAPVLTTTVQKLSATTYSVAAGKDLIAGQTYHWRVQAVDGAGNASPWSQSGEFAVTN